MMMSKRRSVTFPVDNLEDIHILPTVYTTQSEVDECFYSENDIKEFRREALLDSVFDMMLCDSDDDDDDDVDSLRLVSNKTTDRTMHDNGECASSSDTKTTMSSIPSIPGACMFSVIGSPVPSYGKTRKMRYDIPSSETARRTTLCRRPSRREDGRTRRPKRGDESRDRRPSIRISSVTYRSRIDCAGAQH